MGEDRLRPVEYCCPVRVQRVERATARQAFKLPPIKNSRIDPRREVLDAGEQPYTLPFLDQRFHRFLADPLERAQGITDGAVLHGEMRVARVDVGREAFDGA